MLSVNCDVWPGLVLIPGRPKLELLFRFTDSLFHSCSAITQLVSQLLPRRASCLFVAMASISAAYRLLNADIMCCSLGVCFSVCFCFQLFLGKGLMYL